jgi:hypothetical protein
MFQLIFILIILYIIINQLSESIQPSNNSIKQPIKQAATPAMQKILPSKSPEMFRNMNNKINDIEEFDKPNPWTKILFNDKNEYQYLYHIKIPIPTLNDLQAWQQLLPNLDFDPASGELIIPSKDESSALAVANLMINNFSGELTLDNILENNLIQISIEKATKFEVVRSKLREQIVNNLYGSKSIKSKDLATNNLQSNDNSDMDLINIVNKKDNVNKLESFDAYEGGSDFSYL